MVPACKPCCTPSTPSACRWGRTTSRSAQQCPASACLHRPVAPRCCLPPCCGGGHRLLTFGAAALLLRQCGQPRFDFQPSYRPHLPGPCPLRQALLAASGYLAVEAVQGACCAYLARHLCLSTTVDTLLLAFQHDCSELFGQTVGGWLGRVGGAGGWLARSLAVTFAWAALGPVTGQAFIACGYTLGDGVQQWADCVASSHT